MSRMVRIVERARADVDAIFDWLAPRSVSGAISWYLAFRRVVERIGDSAESYGEAAESHRLGRALREALFKTRRGRTYRVIFQVTETEVILLRVRGPGQAPLRRRDLPDR
jgi:plasmid stabilization system protein ParE